MDPNAAASRLEILDAIARYAHAADSLRTSAWSELFTEDGSLELYAPHDERPNAIFEGRATIRSYVERKLQKVLAGVGVEVIDPVNAAFDPSLHEAVSTEPAQSAEEDHTVSRVFQVGYRHNGQLLRPARVVVRQWNG